MAFSRTTKQVYLFLLASFAIGMIELSIFFYFQIGLLSAAGLIWMKAALLYWIALFCAAFYFLRFRALWLLLGLPLVLLPLVMAVIGAGQI